MSISINIPSEISRKSIPSTQWLSVPPHRPPKEQHGPFPCRIRVLLICLSSIHSSGFMEHVAKLKGLPHRPLSTPARSGGLIFS